MASGEREEGMRCVIESNNVSLIGRSCMSSMAVVGTSST
jgi:hypothetical protein